jgi:hypothetical protein
MGENNARNVIVGIYPGASSAQKGLAIMMFLDRICAYFGLLDENIRAVLGPPALGVPTYDPNSTFFFDEESLNNLINLLREAKMTGSHDRAFNKMDGGDGR